MVFPCERARMCLRLKTNIPRSRCTLAWRRRRGRRRRKRSRRRSVLFAAWSQLPCDPSKPSLMQTQQKSGSQSNSLPLPSLSLSDLPLWLRYKFSPLSSWRGFIRPFFFFLFFAPSAFPSDLKTKQKQKKEKRKKKSTSAQRGPTY